MRMLTKKDVQVLREMVREEVAAGIDAKVPRMIEERLIENNHILKREIRDEFQSCIAASEYRLREEMRHGFEKVRDDIAEIINEGVLPQIESHDRRLGALEKRFA